MSKQFNVLLCEHTNEPIVICFKKDNEMFTIEYLATYSTSEEILFYVKALNNYQKLLEFVKSKSLPKLSDNEIKYEFYMLGQNERRLTELSLAQSCRDVLKEIGEAK